MVILFVLNSKGKSKSMESNPAGEDLSVVHNKNDNKSQIVPSEAKLMMPKETPI